jgi:hypothetical protein
MTINAETLINIGRKRMGEEEDLDGVYRVGCSGKLCKCRVSKVTVEKFRLLRSIWNLLFAFVLPSHQHTESGS